MLTYGAEVWGLIADNSIIKKVHRFALKRFLNVSAKTPNALLYGETGRYPLCVITRLKCVRYWLKLLTMPNNRIPSIAYKMLLNMHCHNKNNWVSNVCYTLYTFGFGIVWENQGVGNVDVFLKVFKQRMIDCFQQEWHYDITTKTRFAFYSSFKSVHSVPQAIFDIKNVAIRKALLRFRVGVSSLKPHRYRFSAVNPTMLFCPFCKDTPETEVHFLLVCPTYRCLRESLIPAKFYSTPSALKAARLLANERCSKQLAVFVYKAFQTRNQAATT